MAEPKCHELKAWPEPFDGLVSGDKRHEIRENDRGFQRGDRLRLREWIPGEQRYTGREVWARVTYVSEGGSWGLPAKLCVMSVVTIWILPSWGPPPAGLASVVGFVGEVSNG
jgi:hypothetical protein